MLHWSSGGGIDAEVAEFAIKGRAPDPEAARDFAHPAAVMADGEADEIGFDLLERADIAVASVQSDAGCARNSSQ